MKNRIFVLVVVLLFIAPLKLSARSKLNIVGIGVSPAGVTSFNKSSISHTNVGKFIKQPSISLNINTSIKKSNPTSPPKSITPLEKHTPLRQHNNAIKDLF